MSEVPEHIIDEARVYVKEWANGPASIVFTVARAIQGERAECLKIIENTAQGSLQANLALSLAYETIKKRGEVK